MLLVGLALLIIAMGVAVPKMSQAIKRDREIEMIHRGVQYSRAIKKYYKKFGRYPTTIEQLENTNNIRFLRKKYNDPMSADGKWRFVRYGEVQLGQTGSSTPGAGGSGGVLPGVVGGALGQSSSDSGQQPNGSSQAGATGGTGQPSSFGQPAGGSGTQGSSMGTPVGSMFGSSGTSGPLGGGPILGVASISQKQGIHEFDKKSKYNQWLFVYDPTMDRGGLITGPYNPKAFVGQAQQVGTPAGNLNQPGGSMFNNNSGLGQPAGGTPTPPPQQPPPQNPQ
jgi:type II secretory pathway pseudopilin PulG